MPSKKDVPKVCEQCGKGFLIRRSFAKRGGGRFCTNSCKSKYFASSTLRIGARGADNPAWKGGMTKSSNGYWYVLAPDHHRAMKSGYAKRATLVLETKIGRPLKKCEFAHHIDKNKENDAADNLMLVTHKEHNKLHKKPRKPPKKKQPEHPCNKRYTWPADGTLLTMHKTMSLRKIAAVIGCSHKTVDRRLKKILGS